MDKSGYTPRPSGFRVHSPRTASDVSPQKIRIPFLYGPDFSQGFVVDIGGEGSLVCELESGEFQEVSLLAAMRKFLFLGDNDIDTLDLLVAGKDSPEKLARQKDEFAPPGHRGGKEGQPQHVQLPSKKREDARRYKSNPKKKRDSRNYYHLVCQSNHNCMQRREEYRQHPDKYKRRKAPLRKNSHLREILIQEGLISEPLRGFMLRNRVSGEIVLYDQDNPSNREIKQPGEDVGYSATSPSHYQRSPDEKGGVPSSHGLPNQHHDDANPSSSRVIPDSMKETYQDNLTYTDGGQHVNAALGQQDAGTLLETLSSVFRISRRGSSDLEVLVFLNEAFRKHQVSFSAGGDASRNDLYAKARISSGAINDLGSIEVSLEFGFSEVFDTDEGRKKFASALKVLLTHEMHHRAQLERIRERGRIPEAMQSWLKDIDDYDKYLAKPHEISAHASAAITEMLEAGLDSGKIMSLLRDRRGWVSLDGYSDSFYKYHQAFPVESKEFRRFLSGIQSMLSTPKLAAAISPQNLPPGIGLLIRRTTMGSGGWKVLAVDGNHETKASLSMSKPLGVGPCLGAYEVQSSWSDIKGLGPLLYDIALELAGGSGIMSDRREVSEDARRVWNYYLNSRPDVHWKQLDSFVGTNDDPGDDCKNSSAGVAWRESPLSKVYYKRTKTVIPALRSLGKILGEESPTNKQAALISDIKNNCSEDLLAKAKGVSHTRKLIRPNGMTVWEAVGEKGDKYTIRVKPNAEGNLKSLSKMHVQVSCTCPFFKWQGPEHWASKNDFLYGKPVGSASKPSKKDPSGKHWACKHILAVLNIVSKQKLASSEERVSQTYRQKSAKVFDSSWLSKVRAAWLQRTSPPPLYDAQDCESFLDGAVSWVDALAEDLLFQRGFYHTPQEEGLRSIPQRIKEKAVADLRSVRAKLLEGISWIQEAVKNMTLGSPEYEKGGGQVYAFYVAKDPKSPLRAFYAGCRDLTKETVTEASGIFTRRFLRSLNEAVNKWGVDTPLDFGTKVLEYDVGRLKVVYLDVPASEDGPLGTVLSPGDPRTKTQRHPSAEDYAPYLVKAKALLERAGLGFLWYGTLFVKCKSCGGTNDLGAHFGVGAQYHNGEDNITLFDNPHPRLTKLLLHELGHRYYFRFMSSADRGKFDSYFGLVAPTSAYGATVSPEDFAEVFSEFLTGGDLTREQLERFRVFLNRKTKSASKPVVIRPLGWNATSDEGSSFLKSLEGSHYVFRGVTESEYFATIGAGKPVWSRGDFSHSSEGTNFALSAEDAESYVDFGRDDPRKTGRSNYLVRARRTPDMALGRDGYVKSLSPAEAEAVWELFPVGGEIQIRRLV